MRKLVFGLVAATLLTLGSAANAVITITASTNLNSPNPLTDANAVVTAGNQTTISFGQNPVTTPAFNGSFSFTNSLSGLYSVLVGTSTPGVTFTGAVLTGSGGTWNLTPLGTNGPVIAYALPSTFVASGNYLFGFSGESTNGGVVNGNVTFIQSVAEPGTWGLMLLGFAGVGMALRRSRKQSGALLQIA